MSSAARFFAFAALIGVTSAQTDANATPYLVVDASSGQVLIENEATALWYPAALTDLMTAYVALDAVRAGRLTMDTPLVMSARAAGAPPMKMGFAPGTEVTLDNALKMLMVETANDVAIMIAEGVSGSVEAFADQMNTAARRLGLRESHFVNPDGVHDPSHISSARDIAIVSLALLREFPEHTGLYGIGELQLGIKFIINHNGLLGRYPGADGIASGFTCSAGFNVVASASRSGRRLLVVVLGLPSAKLRTLEAADLFDRGFAMSGGSVSLDGLAVPSMAVAPDMRPNVCLHRSAAAIAMEEREGETTPGGKRTGRGAAPDHTEISDQPPLFDPVPIFIGPVAGWNGPVLGARPPEAPITARGQQPPGLSAVPMIGDGGTFAVPVTINNQLTLQFVVDSGASDVSIPADVVMTLIRTGTITDGDFLGKQTYRLADGSTLPSQQFTIRSLKVGDRILENVIGSIAPVTGSPLLGQSFLSRFKSWSIDNERHALVLN